MGGLFSRPKPQPVARMPDVNDPAVKAAEDRTRRLAMARSGRESTILADRGSSSGTQAYRNTKMGQS